MKIYIIDPLVIYVINDKFYNIFDNLNNKNNYIETMQLIVGKHYELVKKITAGSFGEIYHAINRNTKQIVAVKLQPLKTKHHQLQYQAKLLGYLNEGGDSVELGIPKLYYFGKNQDYHIMIMDLLGPTLQDLFQKCGKKFDLKTVVMVGIQIITRLQYVHSKKFIHRDIKPQNFLIGTHKNCDKIFIIDFGLSKKYIQKNGQHILYKDNKSLTGTPRYASINSHLGIQQSRRDDLQSVIYMLIYFLKGSLPWQNLKNDPNYDRYEKILQKKLSVSIQTLTQHLPIQFYQLIEYTRGLHFIEQPNYNKIKQLLKQSLINSGQQLSQQQFFCWQEQDQGENL